MMRRSPAVTFVILAGGRGERLWPLVRADRPKICLSLDGAKNLLAATIDRLRPVWPTAKWMVVTTAGQAQAVRRCLPPALRGAVLVEPEPKSTAACITVAAAAIARRDPDRVLVVAPADHWIGRLEAYRHSVRAAIVAAARHHAITTIGVRPTHPHTGLGYLCAGTLLASRRSAGARVFRLARFVEKPSRSVAQRLIARPGTYWSVGIFVGSARTFLRCLTEHLPAHVRHLLPLAARVGRPSFTREARRIYQQVPAVSFDHGVMDRLTGGLIVEGRFAWEDLGSWEAWVRRAGEARPVRASSNGARAISVESEQVAVVTHDHHLVATVGVRNLLVVTTPSATLICAPDRAQAVRAVVRRLARDPRLAAYQ